MHTPHPTPHTPHPHLNRLLPRRSHRSRLTLWLLCLTGLLYLNALYPAIAAPKHHPASPSNRALSDRVRHDRVSQVLPLTAPVLQGNQAQSNQIQGNQILLNGRMLPAAWTQWSSGEQRFGLTDAGLAQIAGVELLNTADAASQPVQWFSDPTANPLNLTTWVTGTLRYLDLTALAQRSGWQLQVNGTTLQISSPPATVLAIRQSKQLWGDRLVLELDRSAPWQIDPQDQSALLTVDAQVPAALLQSYQSKPGNRLTAVSIAPSPNRTQLKLSFNSQLRPRVWSLPNPNRLIVDVRPDATIDRDILWAPGLRWQSRTISIGAAQFPVVWLTVDPRQRGVSLKPILPNLNSLVGTAPLIRTAQQAQVAAAINGGFFNRNNQLPLGAIRLAGRWVSGPILGRGAIAWNADGETRFDRLTIQETLITPNGQRLPLTQLNSAYVQAGIARYTSDWGTSYSPLSDNEILVTVQNDRVVSQQPLGATGSSTVPIPANGYLLVLRSNSNAASSVPVGSALRLETIVTPPDFGRFQHIIGGGPLLIQNRQIVLNAKAEQFSNAFAIEQANRSAIGDAADGDLLIAAVHTNLAGTGATLTDMAQIMQQLGAVNALNLDGGSSTTLYLGGQLLDRLPGTAARVYEGIGITVPPSR